MYVRLYTYFVCKIRVFIKYVRLKEYIIHIEVGGEYAFIQVPISIIKILKVVIISAVW
jgi:hypothetical protein